MPKLFALVLKLPQQGVYVQYCRNGKAFMSKQELCEKAESSGLLKANVSMFPQPNITARPVQSE